MRTEVVVLDVVWIISICKSAQMLVCSVGSLVVNGVTVTLFKSPRRRQKRRNELEIKWKNTLSQAFLPNLLELMCSLLDNGSIIHSTQISQGSTIIWIWIDSIRRRHQKARQEMWKMKKSEVSVWTSFTKWRVTTFPGKYYKSIGLLFFGLILNWTAVSSNWTQSQLHTGSR